MDWEPKEKCAQGVWICGWQTENRLWIEVSFFVHMQILHAHKQVRLWVLCVCVPHVGMSLFNCCFFREIFRDINNRTQEMSVKSQGESGECQGNMFQNILHREMYHQCCLEHRYLFLPEGGVTGFKCKWISVPFKQTSHCCTEVIYIFPQQLIFLTVQSSLSWELLLEILSHNWISSPVFDAKSVKLWDFLSHFKSTHVRNHVLLDMRCCLTLVFCFYKLFSYFQSIWPWTSYPGGGQSQKKHSGNPTTTLTETFHSLALPHQQCGTL